MEKSTKKRGRPAIKPYIERIIATRVSDDQKKPLGKRMPVKVLAYEIQREIIQGGKEQPPKLSTLEKRISFYKSVPEDPLDKLWSLGSLVQHPIPPETLPTVMSAYRNCLDSGREFTIGEALWIARLHKLVESADPAIIVNWGVAYALQEWVSKITGEESFNSQELDLQIMKDVHSTPEIVRELEVFGIAERYGADPVKLKDLNLSIEGTEEIAKSGRYKKEAQNERQHKAEKQE